MVAESVALLVAAAAREATTCASPEIAAAIVAAAVREGCAAFGLVGCRHLETPTQARRRRRKAAAAAHWDGASDETGVSSGTCTNTSGRSEQTSHFAKREGWPTGCIPSKSSNPVFDDDMVLKRSASAPPVVYTEDLSQHAGGASVHPASALVGASEGFYIGDGFDAATQTGPDLFVDQATAMACGSEQPIESQALVIARGTEEPTVIAQSDILDGIALEARHFVSAALEVELPAEDVCLWQECDCPRSNFELLWMQALADDGLGQMVRQELSVRTSIWRVAELALRERQSHSAGQLENMRKVWYAAVLQNQLQEASLRHKLAEAGSLLLIVWAPLPSAEL
mmetsp:Transcript_2151/g.3655  ORF Transcript_2151/g.3655 Transcript_2151/m.3655 type:complete len:341 (-) Transcript_2151:155-1177(-)